ncbi:MAG TPA: hypothetical protein VNU97_05100 [Rhizomicrobium sp.]|jgi:hypothetical protein|nr:hypothetical protein [Rhizomicrobium sp.]
MRIASVPAIVPAGGALFTSFSANFGNWYSVLAALGLTALAVYPICAFILRGWAVKKVDIFSGFSTSAKALYLKTFLKEQFADSEADARFEQLYQQRYGRRYFWLPLLLFIVANFVTTFLLSQAAVTWIGLARGNGLTLIGAIPQSWSIWVIPQVAAAGIGGAYLWIVADMISRARRLDLAPADVLNSTLRVALSAALAVAMAQMVTPAVALPLAFAIGAFPLETVRVILRRFASNTLNLGLGVDDNSPDQILNLDGIDHPICDKLMDADITTIAQLAYCDPVQLSMRTGLGFDYVVDCVSQAIAWMYLGDRMDDLRPASLRGAIEIYWFVRQLADTGSQLYPLATALLAVAPGLPQDQLSPPVRRKLEPAQFLAACNEIANDANTRFLIELCHDGGGAQNLVIPQYGALLPKTAA